ncbi:MAG: bifunctional chorismate mutase/prephenate dehydrogenase [Candidatus Diapherotrites archaeon]|nr:bifunctional chorismate mutase/prephenate dehydrogenase [Candidatus Diapherotrites archaeon]
MEKIEKERKKIDSIDRRLAALLRKRMDCSERIGSAKKKQGIAVECLQREKEVREKWERNFSENRLPKEMAESVLESTLSFSKKLQEGKRIKGKKIGIIGFGRFGQFMAGKLKGNFEICAFDAVDRSAEAEKLGVALASFEECASSNIVIFAVPISSLRESLGKASAFFTPGSIVFDVCSVKEFPVGAMAELVPPHCECIGTHPLFGPETAKNGLQGQKIVLCPVRTKRLEKIVSFLESLGLIVIFSGAEEHDRNMARSLSLVHFLGKGLIGIGADKVEFATRTHEMFLELMNIVRKDSKELFEDMHKFNRFAPEARKKMVAELEKLDEELG